MAALVVYYSLSGTTRTVATALAKELAADIDEIGCDRYSPGFAGFIRAGYDSWKGNFPTIEPLSHSPPRYDLVVIAGPIWAFHPATPLRAFLRQQRSELRNVAFLLTHGGSAAPQALRELEQLAGKPPVATLVVREADVKSGRYSLPLSSFASSLRSRAAA